MERENKRRRAEAEATEQKHRRGIEDLERRIAILEQRQKMLESEQWGMADPAVYSDGEKMKALRCEHQENQRSLEALYRKWEEHYIDPGVFSPDAE